MFVVIDLTKVPVYLKEIGEAQERKPKQLSSFNLIVHVIK